MNEKRTLWSVREKEIDMLLNDCELKPWVAYNEKVRMLNTFNLLENKTHATNENLQM